MESAKETTGSEPIKQARRRLIIPVLTLAAAAVVGAFAWAARSYLSSRHAADQVAARLSAIYGGLVGVDAVDIGTDRSTLHGVRLYEEDGEENDPWLVVEGLKADIGAWALFGDSPAASNLDLKGATLTLRLDENGHLLTRFPRPAERKRPFPNLHVKDGTVIFRQAGRLPMTIRGIEAQMELEGSRFVLQGRTDDPHWGEWSATGTIDPETGAGDARFQAKKVDLTLAKLRSLPFVGTNVWDQVQAHGETPVDFTLRFSPAAGSWKYRIVLKPENAWVHVQAIDLVADQVKGEVIIEDAMVTLNELHGRTADGDIQTSADMDFRKRPKELDFRVGVAGVDIRKLPKSWHIPILAIGRLKGEAVLRVVVGGDPRVQTTGGGEGLVNNVLPVKLIFEKNHPHFSLSSGPRPLGP
jgi:translocation and assembly module TamB